MKLNEPFVITISREVGSGGRTIGRKLARKLNVHYSDKQLIKALEEKFNLTVYEIEKLKGEKQNWFKDFIQFVAPVPRASTVIGMEMVHHAADFKPNVDVNDVFLAEKEILNGIADEGSCIIAGRSGFFVLDDRPNKVDIFITASREKRIERVMAKQNLSKEQAELLIDSLDKDRENYVQRYTGSSRSDLHNYDLVINMDLLTEDEAVKLILDYIG